MRNKTGILCMFLGAALIFGALSLYIQNETEAAEAEQAAVTLLPQLVEQIEERSEAASQEGETVPENMNVPEEYLEPASLEMPRVEIGGDDYIGYLSIPALGLELPVMADWSYARLRTAPCRYTGSVRSDDLVLMAHNYDRHFGRLRNLSIGEQVLFTDADGVLTVYEVMGIEVLAPDAVEEMTAGHFDLTLFTCTYGGQSRVTVYCDRASAP